MKEEWKNIKGYENLYQISNLGNIYSVKKNIILKTKKRKGYIAVNLYKDNKIKTYNVHRLVAQAFIPNPMKLSQVNHIDCNKNNNKANNLEWCSASENIIYKYTTKAKREYFFQSLEEEYKSNNEVIETIEKLKKLINL